MNIKAFTCSIPAYLDINNVTLQSSFTLGAKRAFWRVIQICDLIFWKWAWFWYTIFSFFQGNIQKKYAYLQVIKKKLKPFWGMMYRYFGKTFKYRSSRLGISCGEWPIFRMRYEWNMMKYKVFLVFLEPFIKWWPLAFGCLRPTHILQCTNKLKQDGTQIGKPF